MDPESYYNQQRGESNLAPMLIMEQAEFSWELADGSFQLSDLNIIIPKGQFVGVIGRVGSGKSSFLQAITGDLVKKKGRIFVQNWQQGWYPRIDVYFNNRMT